MKIDIAKRVTRSDILLIGCLLAIGIISFLAVRMMTRQGGTTVRILSDGEPYGTYRLSEEQVIPIKKNGVVTNTLQIADNQVKMMEADCPDQLCVHQKAISRQGETIVCLPNKIVVEIEGTKQSDLDSISR